MKIKRLLVVAMAVTLCIGSFWAYDPKQELAIANAQGYAQYGNSEGAYKTISAYPQYFSKDVLENKLFVYGLMLDYIDEFQGLGLLPSGYQYGNTSAVTTPAPTPAPEQPAAPAHEHSYKEEVTKKATCVEEGVLTKNCDCGSVVNEKIPFANHEYCEEVVKAVSCTKNGEVTYTCAICEDTYTEEKAATGHKTGDMVTITEATCLTEGEKGIVCSECGEFIDTTIVPATGHTEGEWEVTTPSGLINNGEKVKKCVDCEEILATEVIPYDQVTLIGIIVAIIVVSGVIGVVAYKKRK